VSDDFMDAVKSVRRIEREEKKAVREMKNELFRVGKAHPDDKGIEEIVDMAKAFGFKPTPPRGPRKRKEHVKNGAEKQRDFRQRQKEEGKRVRWVYDEKLDPTYRRVSLAIHRGSFYACKNEPSLGMYLGKVLEVLDGQIPPEVREDMAGFFKVLGLNPYREEARASSA